MYAREKAGGWETVSKAEIQVAVLIAWLFLKVPGGTEAFVRVNSQGTFKDPLSKLLKVQRGTLQPLSCLVFSYFGQGLAAN